MSVWHQPWVVTRVQTHAAQELIDIEVDLRSERAAANRHRLLERLVVAADLEDEPDHRVQVARHLEIPAFRDRLVFVFDGEGDELVAAGDLGPRERLCGGGMGHSQDDHAETQGTHTHSLHYELLVVAREVPFTGDEGKRLEGTVRTNDVRCQTAQRKCP